MAARVSAHEGQPLVMAQLGAPVPAPRSIFGLVANYPPATLPDPPVPMVFGRFPSSVIGPFDNIRIPVAENLPMAPSGPYSRRSSQSSSVKADGTSRRRRSRSDRWIYSCPGRHRAGTRVRSAEDVGGDHGLQSLKALGKSLDTFCPLGPVLVALDEFEDPHALELECRLNGEVVQKASTRDLPMGVADVVTFLSAFVTLRPGDVILTGTPTPLAGQIPRLTPGGTVETETAGVGTMRNTCVDGNS